MTTVRSHLVGLLVSLAFFAASCGGGGNAPRGIDATPCTGMICNGACVDLMTNYESCGACGTKCTAGTMCSNGACVVSCPMGQMACPTGTPTYCASTMTDVNNCGGCGNVCPGGQACAVPSGAIAATCSCPATSPDACGTGATAICTDFQTDPYNCGKCGTVCGAGTMCSKGACVVACPGKETACPAASPTYCADTTKDLNNCGGCGVACAPGQICASATAGGTPSCTCPTNLPNQCGTGKTATCVSFQTDPYNCGKCANVCPTATVCSSGACVPSCPTSQTVCAAAGGAFYCASTMTDANDCGACGTVCAPGQTCAGGSCSCTGSTPNTCGTGAAAYCTHFASDPANCGRCSNACPTGTVCSSGSCITSCLASETACPAAGGGTYCTDTTQDSNNCGGCGNVCVAGQVCTGSTCSCPSATPNACGAGGTGYCTNFNTDPTNCGGCTIACPAGTICSLGACAETCASGYTACPPSGPTYCANLSTDPLSCGACGKACAGNQTCLSGTCGYPPSCASLHAARPALPSGIYWISVGAGPFPVYCDMVNDGGGWTMVYKISHGLGGDPVSIWTSGALNETNTANLNVMIGSQQYANRILAGFWNAGGYKLSSARAVLYSGGAQADYIRFNAAGTTNMSWFAPANVLASSWADLTPAQTYNYFSIAGDSSNGREWFVHRNYGGCGFDAGWMVLDVGSPCFWDTRFPPAPEPLYSSLATFQNANFYVAAEVFAVFVR